MHAGFMGWIEESRMTTLEAESAEVIRELGGARGFTITRASDAHPHTGRKQRGADEPGFALHPAIARGMAQMRESGDVGGARAVTLFSNEAMHVSYVWFKSGYPLPIHSHDVDCFYQIFAGSMKVGSEVLGKGDGVMIPAGVPYTVTPGEQGVEFFEFRTGPDYDTHYRAKTDTYWDRVSEVRRERKAIWAQEQAPYGLLD
jgi:mannose-6-phosphate isomerase-like protein (cupin superfamily)